MAAFVDKTSEIWLHIFDLLSSNSAIDTHTNTIVIDCEWAGGNIQKGNAACSGIAKGAYIFDYFRIVNNDTDETQYKSTEDLNSYADHSIYLISYFGRCSVSLDFNNPKQCEKSLQHMAETIEDKSLIALYHNKPDNVGEGVYLYGEHEGIRYHLKAKGLKHGGKPKDKSNKPKLSDEDKQKFQGIADKVTPEWRITQAITETEATQMKHIGQVIKWVNQDIVKEEMPVLHEAGVELKKINGFIAQIVKDYYIEYIKEY